MTTPRGRAFADLTGRPLPDDFVCLQCDMRFSAAAYDHFQSHVAHHERLSMAKTPARKPPKKAPAAGATRRDTSPPPFLTAADLSGRTRFRILSSITVFVRDNRSTALFIHIENQKREPFTWSLNCASPDRISLQKMHGRNVLDWPGKVVELHPVDGTNGGRFVNLYDADYKRPAPAAAAHVPDDEDIPF